MVVGCKAEVVLVLYLLVGLSVAVIREQGRCATYGDCDGLPCVDNGKARSASSESSKVLSGLCPHLKVEDGVCCTEEQVGILVKKLGKADARLKKCNTAVSNFRALICDFTCSPNQSQFVEVVESQSYQSGRKAKKLKYYVSEEYSDKTFYSIVKTSRLICGNVVHDCKKEGLFKFIGNNPFTSLKTEYVISASAPAGFTHAPANHVTCDRNSTEERCQCY